MRLVEGAQAIRGDLPSSSTVIVDIPLEAGDDQGSAVARLSSLLLVRDKQAEALRTADGWVLTIGGDCGVELASVSHATADADVAVLWFDAHPDLNTPESSPSGAFHGMVLRTLLGEGDPTLVPAKPLAVDHVILVGTRAYDEGEESYVSEVRLRELNAADLTVESLVSAVELTGATSVYLHIDLDVLDPAEFTGLGEPEPFGLTTASLIQLIRGVRARFPLAGAGLTEFAPASEEQASDDLPTILRILGALTTAGD
jgi:arginase